jgi:hypothetical protein
MHASLRALLTGLIDYAGLFPPAGLPLDQAVGNYARFRTEPQGWMLGRFICPAARLRELDRYVPALFQEGPPLALSVLVGKGNTLAELLTSLAEDVNLAAALQARHAGRLTVEVLEIRLPVAEGELEPEKLQETLLGASEAIESWVRAPVTPFFETTLGPGWVRILAEVLGGIALANTARATEGRALFRPAGLKLRCGGLEPSTFPSPEQVAHVIDQCRTRGVAFKATAGLHHPFRRYHKPLRAPMHGFVNVFAAAVLAYARHLPETEIRGVMEDEDAGHFVFDDEGFRWREVRATTAEVAAARGQFATSFGSCSFDEPRDDLRALGWL